MASRVMARALRAAVATPDVDIRRDASYKSNGSLEENRPSALPAAPARQGKCQEGSWLDICRQALVLLGQILARSILC